MKGRKPKNGDIDWNDYLKRNFMWAWPFIFLCIFIIFGFIFILIVNGIAISENYTMIILTIMFIVSLITLIYGLYILYITFKRAKKVSLSNYNISIILTFISVIFIFLLLFGGWYYLMEILEPDIDILIVPYVIQVLLFAFLIISVINIYYHGSITQWYNNLAVQYGQKISTLHNGYTERPYSMKLINSEKLKNLNIKLENFGVLLSKNMIITGYEKIPNGIILYLPSTSLMYGLVGDKRNVEKATKITAFNDGNISIFISKFDYDSIGFKITYHNLCQVILTTFADSIMSFIKGDEGEAVNILCGKEHGLKRKKFSRKQTYTTLRLFTVITIVNLLLNIGLIPLESIVYQDEYRGWISYPEERNPIQYSYPFGGRHGLIGFNVGSGIWEGDEFIISFNANRTIPNVYIVRKMTNNSYQTISKGLQNVSEGKIKFRASTKSGEYRLVFDIWEEGLIIPVDINFTIIHVNSYSYLNAVLGLILILFYIPIEYVFRKDLKKSKEG